MSIPASSRSSRMRRTHSLVPATWRSVSESSTSPTWSKRKARSFAFAPGARAITRPPAGIAPSWPQRPPGSDRRQPPRPAGDRRSTPRYGWPLNSTTSCSRTFQAGRLWRNVWHAHESISTRATWSNPARSSPSACPPAPAQISTEVSGIGQPTSSVPSGPPTRVGTTRCIDSADESSNCTLRPFDRRRTGG